MMAVAWRFCDKKLICVFFLGGVGGDLGFLCG